MFRLLLAVNSKNLMVKACPVIMLEDDLKDWQIMTDVIRELKYQMK